MVTEDYRKGVYLRLRKALEEGGLFEKGGQCQSIQIG